jgi:hypothetical protein
MFKNLAFMMQNNAFLTWPSGSKTLPLGGLRLAVLTLYLSPTGGLYLPSGKHGSILTYLQTIDNKKMTKKSLFLAIFTL